MWNPQNKPFSCLISRLLHLILFSLTMVETNLAHRGSRSTHVILNSSTPAVHFVHSYRLRIAHHRCGTGSTWALAVVLNPHANHSGGDELFVFVCDNKHYFKHGTWKLKPQTRVLHTPSSNGEGQYHEATQPTLCQNDNMNLELGYRFTTWSSNFCIWSLISKTLRVHLSI